WLPDPIWGNGHVVLLGDAAHAMSPMMGQGGCMAVEDALVLAEELRRTPEIPAALAAFVARRQPRVAWVREQSRALGEMVRLPAASPVVSSATSTQLPWYPLMLLLRHTASASCVDGTPLRSSFAI